MPANHGMKEKGANGHYGFLILQWGHSYWGPREVVGEDMRFQSQGTFMGKRPKRERKRVDAKRKKLTDNDEGERDGHWSARRRRARSNSSVHLEEKSSKKKKGWIKLHTRDGGRGVVHRRRQANGKRKGGESNDEGACRRWERRNRMEGSRATGRKRGVMESKV